MTDKVLTVVVGNSRESVHKASWSRLISDPDELMACFDLTCVHLVWPTKGHRICSEYGSRLVTWQEQAVIWMDITLSGGH